MGYIQHRSEESVEDYLETILVLSKRLPAVRSIDIANELGYSKPSVSVAMKNLRNRQYITVSEEGFIQLTDEGRRLASMTYERHTILTDWFVSLGVSPETAAADACRIEHDLSDESFAAIKRHISGDVTVSGCRAPSSCFQKTRHQAHCKKYALHRTLVPIKNDAFRNAP